MNHTQEELNMERRRFIRAYNNHHLTWKELMEAINLLQLEALQLEKVS